LWWSEQGRRPRRNSERGRQVSTRCSTPSVIHLLHRAAQCADCIFSEEIAGTDLTPRQYTVLAVIADKEGLSQTELVMRTGIDRSTVADMIKRLVIGHIRRNWPAVELMVRGDSHFATAGLGRTGLAVGAISVHSCAPPNLGREKDLLRFLCIGLFVCIFEILRGDPRRGRAPQRCQRSMFPPS
jgi:hypothetical protein